MSATTGMLQQGKSSNITVHQLWQLRMAWLSTHL
jgi:hypothetical protein